MKCNQPRPGFELVSPCPFPTSITITPRGYNAVETTKNIYYAKGGDGIDHSIVIRCFKEFRSGCNNFDGQEKCSAIFFSEVLVV